MSAQLALDFQQILKASAVLPKFSGKSHHCYEVLAVNPKLEHYLKIIKDDKRIKYNQKSLVRHHQLLTTIEQNQNMTSSWVSDSSVYLMVFHNGVFSAGVRIHSIRHQKKSHWSHTLLCDQAGTVYESSGLVTNLEATKNVRKKSIEILSIALLEYALCNKIDEYVGRMSHFVWHTLATKNGWRPQFMGPCEFDEQGDTIQAGRLPVNELQLYRVRRMTNIKKIHFMC